MRILGCCQMILEGKRMDLTMSCNQNAESNQEGFILVITMFILVVLSIIGISATNLTELELRVAGNDRVHKKTFYMADGGTDVGIRMQYDNAICTVTSGGFTGNFGTGNAKRRIDNHVVVDDLDFSMQPPPAAPATLASQLKTGAVTPHLTYYTDIDLLAVPTPAVSSSNYYTDIMTSWQIRRTPGSGLQMVSGYEGLGASSAAGGTHSLFTVASQHHGELDSSSLVTIQWRMSNHILNNAAVQDCKY